MRLIGGHGEIDLLDQNGFVAVVLITSAVRCVTTSYVAGSNLSERAGEPQESTSPLFLRTISRRGRRSRRRCVIRRKTISSWARRTQTLLGLQPFGYKKSVPRCLDPEFRGLIQPLQICRLRRSGTPLSASIRLGFHAVTTRPRRAPDSEGQALHVRRFRRSQMLPPSFVLKAKRQPLYEAVAVEAFKEGVEEHDLVRVVEV
jgi:hypothetical protein